MSIAPSDRSSIQFWQCQQKQAVGHVDGLNYTKINSTTQKFVMFKASTIIWFNGIIFLASPALKFVFLINHVVAGEATFVYLNSADDIFRCIFVNEKFCILIQISLKFVPKGQIDYKSALFQVMAWRRTGDKPLPEPMLTQFTGAYMRH